MTCIDVQYCSALIAGKQVCARLAVYHESEGRLCDARRTYITVGCAVVSFTVDHPEHEHDWRSTRENFMLLGLCVREVRRLASVRLWNDAEISGETGAKTGLFTSDIQKIEARGRVYGGGEGD